MQVAEIVVRFGGDILDVRQLSTGSYRIGTGRDVDLAVVGLTSFPLVDWTDRCMLRVPAGIAARKNGAAFDGAAMLMPGDRIALSIGEVEITVELTGRAATLPKPRFETSSLPWIAGALVAHLIALLVVDTLADPESETVRVASIVSLLPQLPEPPPLPTTKPQMHVPVKHKVQATNKPVQVAAIDPKEPEIEMSHAPEPKRRARAVETARKAGILGSFGGRETFAAVYGKADLAKELSDVGPVYDEVAAEGKRFGGGRRFDPTKREGWGTVETGRYATVSKGRAVGDQYQLPGEVAARPVPKVALCVGSCSASETMKVAIARYEEAILGCYERNGQGKRGDVVVEIEVGEDGKVISTDGAGLGTTGSCVAGVIRRVAFPIGRAVTVRYPLSFSPG